MLASCAVFNEAHDQAITFLGLNYNSRDLRLTELDERFNSTLATNKIIACRVRVALSRANGDRTLEPDIGDALHDFLKITPIADPRVQKANLVNGNGLNSLRASSFRFAHTAS